MGTKFSPWRHLPYRQVFSCAKSLAAGTLGALRPLRAVVAGTAWPAATSFATRWATTEAPQYFAQLLSLVIIDSTVLVGVGFEDAPHRLGQFVLAYLPVAVFVQVHESLREIPAARAAATGAAGTAPAGATKLIRWSELIWAAGAAPAGTTELIRTPGSTGAFGARSAAATTELRTHFLTTQFAVAVLVELLQGRYGVCNLVGGEFPIVIRIEGGHHGMRRGTKIAVTFAPLGSTAWALSVTWRLFSGPRRLPRHGIGKKSQHHGACEGDCPLFRFHRVSPISNRKQFEVIVSLIVPGSTAIDTSYHGLLFGAIVISRDVQAGPSAWSS